MQPNSRRLQFNVIFLTQSVLCHFEEARCSPFPHFRGVTAHHQGGEPLCLSSVRMGNSLYTTAPELSLNWKMTEDGELPV